MNHSAGAAALSTRETPWIANLRWDMTWMIGSAALVAVPVAAHFLLGVGANGVDLLVTALIGGPHMYATFLRTVFEPKFRERHRFLAWFPVVFVPTAVILASTFAFTALLSFFFMWASIHICDQASYIAQQYRLKSGGSASILERALDFAAILSSLYVVAMYRFVDGTFVISGYTVWFPEFLKVAWWPRLFAFGAAVVISTWAVRSINAYRAGRVGRPYLAFMLTTMVVSFLVPMMKELSVSFQGFNAWHSFQYLGLTFFALNQRNGQGAVTSKFVKNLAGPRDFFRYYGWNVLLTVGAGVIVGILIWIIKLPQEQSYYTVVLSFLLVHYFHDHVLFSDSQEPSLSTGRAAAGAASSSQALAA
ncbi:MAG: hypothetical protein JNK60_12585 [Acidobacteria bacterium]|nr:hypothetical protein [Acidobacteriota bacterium]